MKIEPILNPAKFEKWLLKNVGKRCKDKDYAWDCLKCRSWRLYDDVESYCYYVDVVLELSSKWQKRKIRRKLNI